ncbi:KxYKxGKxW signal peptide domain-containing protein [Streptococcus suis]|uniref:KxYKxGKxW signal peptide domain-containing protein n=1 Tax=Streptococcus suis TaxID=1307 RepID=UPI00137532D3|nr:KxYKxGKxW signal peptide domain-containing protein [Streptococcus suis]HEM5336184.1 KxYKxGKxW signal peptide domain-containing protein [Streptococcus suis]
MFDKEKNQGRFRMWKSGKQWLYSGLIIIVLIGVGVVGGSGLIHNTEAEVAEKSRVTYLDGRRETNLPGAEGERPDSNPLGINPLGGRRETNLPGAEGERPNSNESLVESGFELSSGGEVEVGYELKNGGTVVVGFEPV